MEVTIEITFNTNFKLTVFEEFDEKIEVCHKIKLNIPNTTLIELGCIIIEENGVEKIEGFRIDITEQARNRNKPFISPEVLRAVIINI